MRLIPIIGAVLTAISFALWRAASRTRKPVRRDQAPDTSPHTIGVERQGAVPAKDEAASASDSTAPPAITSIVDGTRPTAHPPTEVPAVPPPLTVITAELEVEPQAEPFEGIPETTPAASPVGNEASESVFRSGQTPLLPAASEADSAELCIPENVPPTAYSDSPISCADDVASAVETPTNCTQEVSGQNSSEVNAAYDPESAAATYNDPLAVPPPATGNTTEVEIEAQVGPSEGIPRTTPDASPADSEEPESVFNSSQAPVLPSAAPETDADERCISENATSIAHSDSPISWADDAENAAETPTDAKNKVLGQNSRDASVADDTESIGATYSDDLTALLPPTVDTAEVEVEPQARPSEVTPPTTSVVSPVWSKSPAVVFDTGTELPIPVTVSDPVTAGNYDAGRTPDLERISEPDSPITGGRDEQIGIETPDCASEPIPEPNGNQPAVIPEPIANVTEQAAGGYSSSNARVLEPISVTRPGSGVEPKTAQNGHACPTRIKEPRQAKRKRNHPSKYVAPVRTPDALTAPREQRAPSAATALRARALNVAIHVHLRARNRCQVALLPERVEGLAETIVVRGPQGSEEWNALQDEWYGDFMPDGLGRILRDGARWETEGDSSVYWTLARERYIYVLAGRPESGIFGFVTTTRLLLRQDHLVLCTREMESDVRHALADAGCPAPVSLDEQAGVPTGWVLFKDVRPTRAVPHDSEQGIINVLRPVHEVEIELRGGIRVERLQWLNGHPPQVRLRGDNDNLEVTIDQQTAERDQDGNYTVPKWNSPGVHRVFCGGATASFELIAPPSTWATFPAITYKRTAPPAWAMAICGPIVKGEHQDTVLLASAGPTLVVGAMPGQIALAVPPFDVRSRGFLATADFPIVWTVPSTPLHANRETNSIQLVHDHRPDPVTAAQMLSGAVRRWAHAIMDASYKRLRIEPDTDEAKRLWAEYKRMARRIKKASR